jgi:hypothetical protein
MKEISQSRLILSQLYRMHRPVKDFYQQHVTRINPGCSLEDLQSVKYFLSDKFFPTSEFLQLPSVWPETVLSAEVVSLLKQIVAVQEEILITNDVLIFDELLMKFKSLYTQYLRDSEALIELLKSDYKKVSKIHLLSAKTWSASNQVVFHGIKFEYAGGILEEQKIKGYTTQRYWADGKRRQEDDADYEDSFWMKGISTTRSLEFAAAWAPVVLVLDLSLIKHEKEVVPYAWNFHMKGSTNFKKETEEFVVLSRTGKRFKMSENPEFMKEYEEGIQSSDPEVREYYEKSIQKHDTHAFDAPAGELDISKCVMGIFLVGYIIDIYGLDNPLVQQVLNHPKFIGILEK